MSNETLLKMRSDRFRSLEISAPSPGVTAGKLYALTGGLTGVAAKDAATGAKVALIYACDKIIVEKDVATADNISQGGKVYFNPSTGKVSGATATGRRIIGVALENAGLGTSEVLIDLDGTKGIAAQAA